MAFLYWFADPALRVMGQTDSISAQGAIYAKGLIPQCFSFAINNYLITPAVGMASKGR
jgi:MATE family multidrug resistance protein